MKYSEYQFVKLFLLHQFSIKTMEIIERLNRWGKKRTPFVALVDFELQKPLAYTLEECPMKLRYNFQGQTNYKSKNDFNLNTKLEAEFVDYNSFKKKFDKSLKHINRGDSYLINLTEKTKINTKLNFEKLFIKSNAKYTIWLKDEFISFSPETFITINKGIISTYPMKGTIEHHDATSEIKLQNNIKEQSEHATIVDLLRNDLSRVSKKVTVENYRYYEVLQTSEKQIGQISSKITGQLEEDFYSKLGNIIFSLLPAGSICGAPKEKTVKLIKEIEVEKRGYYTGIAIYFDGANLDSCVLIRYIDEDHYYRSGGGITFLSQAEEEYQELKNKVYVPIV